ncbi:PTS sugar transporter subunit IIA [Candidatus Stoquefichus massiliensis]|uniref:PTS sugar transporter subunit IIA n=1 Tax=Candidatus Stoquefichus massiliensis TaxID=1470350 RepID=UPI0004894241|nr:PTS sugar transporter subunit IIA [Candidatus Stoquefichus massiliensis]
MNERQQFILELLIHATSPIPIDSIVSQVQKSKRTVLRDLSTIKMYLESENIGELINNNNGYKINITEVEKYKDLINQYINDEEVILYELIQRDYLTIDDLSQCLYVSKMTASEKMNIVKTNYSQYLNIEVSRKGHYLNEKIIKKCMLLCNLIENNIKYYLNLFHIPYENYVSLEELISNNNELKEDFPNCSTHQIAILFIAATIYQGSYEKQEIQETEFLEYYQKASINANEKADTILQTVSLHCININLSLSKHDIYRILGLMKSEMMIDLDEEDELVYQLYDHLKRVLCFPHYLKMKEIYNISDFKALYPFSFDLSFKFIQYLKQLYHYEIPNTDFIGLYFAVCLEKIKEKKHKIIIYSSKNAIAYLNKQLLMDYLNNIEIIITKTLDVELMQGASLVIDSIGNLKLDQVEVIYMDHILNEEEMIHIETILDNVSIHKNKYSIFPKSLSYEYHVKEDDTWEEILNDICLKLQETNTINNEEKTAILNRENHGNALIINNYIIPHCISKKENFVICVYIHLDKDIIVDERHIQHVLVTVLNPLVQKNVNLFKFLYNYLNENKELLQSISTYDDFIKQI